LPSSGPRANHDALISVAHTTSHGMIGLATNLGRIIRYSALGLPTVPCTANAPNLQGGSPVDELFSLESGERVLGLIPLDERTILALGTRQGVVKRLKPESLSKDSWEIIRLDDGDEVVGVATPAEDDELVFISSDAQLLHFPAALVRPQGRTGGGMAGIKLTEEAQAIWFGSTVLSEALVVTISGTTTALPGAQVGNVKVTPFAEYPGKGRATGGVRCHRFLKGEDTLLLGWVGPSPAIAASDAGTPIDLPPATGKRDGSGTPAAQPLAAVASRVHH